MKLNKSNSLYLWSVALLVTMLGIHGCGRNMELGMTNDQQESSGPRKRKLPTSPSSPESKRARSINLKEVPLVSLSPSTLPKGQSSSSVVYPTANISSQHGASTLASSSSIESASGEKAKRPLEQGFAAPPAKRARPSEEQEEVFSQGSLSPEVDVCETASLKERNEALINAASKGDYGTVQRLLSTDKGVDINAQYNGYTALIKAIEGGYAAVVETLFAHGADVTVGWYGRDLNDEPKTPLTLAVATGNIAIFNQILAAELALRKDVNVEKREKRWESAFAQALNQDHVEIAEQLIKNGLDKNFALREAVAQGNLNMVRSILKDPLVDAQNSLIKALKDGHKELIQEFLAHGVDVSYGYKDEHREELLIAPITLAAANGDMEIFEQIFAAELALKEQDEELRKNEQDSIHKVSLAERHAKRVHRLNSAFAQALARQALGQYRATDITLFTLLIDAGVCKDFALREAVRRGNPAVVRLLLDRDAYIDTGIDKEENTPLLLALDDFYYHGKSRDREKCDEIAQLLIERGAYLEAVDHEGVTTLMLAAQNASVDTIHLLLHTSQERDGNRLIHTVDKNGNTALHYAVGYRDGTEEEIKEAVELLIDYGTNFFAENKEGETLLDMATEGYFLPEVVKVLIKAGAMDRLDPELRGEYLIKIVKKMRLHDPELMQLFWEREVALNLQDDEGKTALMWAATQGNAEAVCLLLERGANPSLQDNNEETALIHAAKQGNPEVVRLLLERGANPSLQDNNGKTALMHAAIKGNVGAMRLLLERGADPNPQDNNRKTALMHAAEQENPEAVQLLLERGVNPNLQDNNGKTALMWASKQGNVEAMRVLLENKANPDLQDENEMTALIQAVKQGNVEVMRVLLENKANPDLQDENGMTALIQAVKQGNVEAMRVLLENKANPDLQDQEGMTALMWATKQRNVEVMRVLFEHRADPGIQDNEGKTALQQFLAKLPCLQKGGQPTRIEETVLEYLQLFSEQGVAIDSIHVHEANLLTWAMSQNYSKVFEWLLREKRIEINAPNLSSGTTLLMEAVKKGKELDFVRSLLDAGAAVDIRDQGGRTVLYYAMNEIYNTYMRYDSDAWKENRKTDCITMIQLFLDKGANAKAIDNEGKTTLHQAIEVLKKLLRGVQEARKRLLPIDEVNKNLEKQKGQLKEIVDQLFSPEGSKSGNPLILTTEDHDERKTSFSITSESEDSGIKINALYSALQKSDLGTTQNLLNERIDAYTQDEALKNSLREKVRIILLNWKKAPKNKMEHERLTQKYRDVWTHFVKISQLLLDRGAELDKPDRSGKSPLIILVEMGALKTAEFLISKATIIQESEANKVLLLAIKKGDRELAQLLLDKGASAHAVDDEGKTALQYAGDNQAIVELLRQRGTQG